MTFKNCNNVQNDWIEKYSFKYGESGLYIIVKNDRKHIDYDMIQVAPLLLSRNNNPSE